MIRASAPLRGITIIGGTRVDLRRTPRVPLQVLVDYTIKGKPESYSGRARDISLGGMFIETSETPPFGAELVVHLVLPAKQVKLLLPGLVRWTEQDGVGVQFGSLGVRETHEITEIVRLAGRT